MLLATPNSVILTPCFRKESTVVVSSGTRLPIATSIPVKSQLMLQRLEMFIREGMRNFSAIRAKFRSKQKPNIISKRKKNLFIQSLLNSRSHSLMVYSTKFNVSSAMMLQKYLLQIKLSIYFLKMNSNNSAGSFQSEGYLGTLLIYMVISIIFFYLGRNYDRIKTEVQQRTTEKRGSKYAAYQKVKRKKDDEESTAIPLVHTQKNSKEKYLEKNLEESKMELKQLSSELSRLRQRDQNLSAENQILKSKLMNQQHEASSSAVVATGGAALQTEYSNSVSGTHDQPISDRFEENKDSSGHGNEGGKSNAAKKKKRKKQDEEEEDLSDEEDLVNEIDNFLIEDEDL